MNSFLFVCFWHLITLALIITITISAARGLKVACIERADFSSGTSSRSTKLIWAGSRYLVNAGRKQDREDREIHTDIKLIPFSF